jgi:hypothetical protein
MESSKEFRKQGYKMIDYLADYFENTRVTAKHVEQSWRQISQTVMK